MKCFYNFNITLNYWLVCKINNFISKCSWHIWYVWLVLLCLIITILDVTIYHNILWWLQQQQLFILEFNIFLINSLEMCFFTLSSLVFTVIKLGHRITYEKSWSSEYHQTVFSNNMTMLQYAFLVYLFSTAFSSLYDKNFETDGERSCRIDESIAL